MKDLTPITQAHKNQLDSEWPFIWLYEIETAEEPEKTMYRFTNYTERVTFNQNVFYPAPIIHSGINSGSDGSLPTIDFALGNASLEVAPVIDAADGLVGRFVRISVVSLLDIANLDAPIVQEGEIIGSTMDHEKINVSVGAFNFFQSNFPPFAYSRRKCKWLFGSGECGYDVNAPGAGFEGCGITTSSETVAAPFTLEACNVVGDDEDLIAVTRNHPDRFGGYPAIPPARRF